MPMHDLARKISGLSESALGEWRTNDKPPQELAEQYNGLNGLKVYTKDKNNLSMKVLIDEDLPVERLNDKTENTFFINSNLCGLFWVGTEINNVAVIGQSEMMSGKRGKWPENIPIKLIEYSDGIYSIIYEEFGRLFFDNSPKIRKVSNNINEYIKKVNSKNIDFPNPDNLIAILSCNKSVSWNSFAQGLSLDKTSVNNVVFLKTDLRAMSAKGLFCKGAIVFDTCMLDRINLDDYSIESDGALQITYDEIACSLVRNEEDGKNRGVVRDAVIITTKDNKGNLEFRNIRFESCSFSLDSEKECLFEPSCLVNVIFDKCDFKKAQITQRKNEGPFDWIFQNCILTGTNFIKVNGSFSVDDAGEEIIANAKFSDCTLYDFRLLKGGKQTNVAFTNTTIRNPNIEGVTFNEGTWNDVTILVEEGKTGNFSNVTFNGIDFSKTKFEIIGSLSLTNTHFEDCTLKGVDFKNIDIEGVEFNNCSLLNCTMQRSPDKIIRKLTITGEKTTLKNVTMTNATFENIIMADIPDDQIKEADCSNSKFTGGNFENIKLEEWKAKKASFLGVTFSKTVFQNCTLESAKFLPDDNSKKSCIFESADFTNQHLKNIEFNGVKCDKNTNFSGCFFENIKIGCIELFVNRPNFAGTSFNQCEFCEGLDLRDFPFGDIKEIKHTTFKSVKLNNIRAKCAFDEVQFIDCDINETTFSGDLNNVTIQKKKQIQNVCLSGKKLSNVRLTSKSSEEKSEWENLQISCAEVIENLALENIGLKSFTIEKCKEIRQLKIKDCKVINGKLKDVGKLYVNMHGSELPALSIENTTFDTEESCIEKCTFSNLTVRKSNMLDIKKLSGVKINEESKFEECKIQADFAKLKEKELTKTNFIACDFRGSQLNGADLQECKFDNGCDFREIVGKNISSARFENSTILANIDGLTFYGCQLMGTRFSDVVNNPEGPYRKLKNVIFRNCEFDSKTCFAHVHLKLNSQNQRVFEYSEGATPGTKESFNKLVFRDVKFEGLSFVGFETKNVNCMECLDCSIEDCHFEGNFNGKPFLKFVNSTVKECTYKGMKFDFDDNPFKCERTNLINNKFFNCNISNVVFSSGSTIDNVSLVGCNFELTLKECRIKQLNFIKQQPGPHQASSQENATAPKMKLKILDSVFSTNDPISFTEFKKEDFEGDRTFSYYADMDIDLSEFEAKLKSLGFDIKHEGTADVFRSRWGAYTAQENINGIKNFYINKGLDKLRHPEEDVSIKDMLDILSRGNFLDNPLKGNISDETWKKLLEGLQELWFDIKKLSETKKSLSDSEVEAVDKKMKSLMQDTIMAKAKHINEKIEKMHDGNKERFSVEIKACNQQDKVYCDFGILWQIVTRILKNIQDHCSDPSRIQITTDIRDIDISGDYQREYYLCLGNDGEGIKTEADLRSLLDSQLFNLVKEYSVKYCNYISFGTTIGNNKISHRIKKGICDESDDISWFENGTHYEFHIQLPYSRHNGLEKEIK